MRTMPYPTSFAKGSLARSVNCAVGVHIDANTCLSSCADCGVELGVCGADGIGGVGGRNTPVYVNVCLDAADGLCLHNTQATWRASTALRSVDGDAEIMRTCFDMGKNRKCDGGTMQRTRVPFF